MPSRTAAVGAAPAAAARPAPRVRRIFARDVGAALAAGWRDFLRAPTQLVFLVLLYPLVGLFAAWAAAERDLTPLVWPLVAGFALVGPVAALGIYEISRRIEQGRPVSWLTVFDVLRAPALPAIALLALAVAAIFLAWLGTAQAIYQAAFAERAPASVAAFLVRVFTTPEGLWLIVVGNAVGFLFAAVVLSVTVVSFPLLLDRPGTGVVTAVAASVRAVQANPGPMALWGLTVAVVLAAGMVPLFVGLAVALPVLGHATWHLYRIAVEP
jgi:uncharacterized membrane protein